MLLWVVVVLGYFLLASEHLSEGMAEDQRQESKSSVILRVEKKLICVYNDEPLKVTCSLTVKDGTESTNLWSLSWYAEGRRLGTKAAEEVRNSTTLTSSLNVFVSWPAQKLVTCVGRSKGTRNVSRRSLNSSLVVRIKPPAIPTFIGFRFLEKPSFKIVEAFWRPIDLNSTVYNLKYCVENIDEFLGPACPRYRSIESKCLVRQKDYYNVPNTTGLICKATFKQTVTIYEVHKLYIASHKAGCESAGAVHRVQLAFWKDPSPNPNITELVMTPYPIANLQIVATKRRRIRITWSNPRVVQGINTRKYTVNYVCLKSKTHESKIESMQTKASLVSSDFRKYQPYDLCQFCVTAVSFENGLPSKPVCNDTRLHEEAPTGAPRITCAGDDCKSTSNGMERNVTITWVLPPEEDWNGVLLSVKVIYRPDMNGLRNLRNEINVTNLKKGETVLTELVSYYSYTVRMVTCNKEGCSALGNAAHIPALSNVTPRRKSQRWPVIVGSSVGGSFFVFLGLYFVYVAWTRLQKRRDGKISLLPLLFEPVSYDDVKGPDDGKLSAYEVLNQHKYIKEDVTTICTLPLGARV